jgi:hypothetical protein
MKRFSVIVLVATLVLMSEHHRAFGQTGGSGAGEGSGGIRAATVLTLHGKIVDVDRSNKTVTLEFNGNRVNLRVENPTNLAAAQVGEGVLVRYYEVVKIRKKKPDENVSDVSVKNGIVTAAPGGTPGAVAEQHAKVVVTVTAVDPGDGTLTIQGPDGAPETVKAVNPGVLKKIKTGDELVVSISRATAISLEKDTGA